MLIRSEKLSKFSEIIFAFSTAKGGVSQGMFGMNLGIFTPDDESNVRRNRDIFFREAGIPAGSVVFQRQIHSCNVSYAEEPAFIDECDGLYTDRRNVFLTVTAADCIPVFVYEPVKKVVAAVHSGWKGTSSKILTGILEETIARFGADPEKMVAYIGPGISKESYEVGEDVAKFFDSKYLLGNGSKFLLDLKQHNFDQLTELGVPRNNIEVSELCTYREKDLLHSFRRDGNKSGRMMGVIGLK